eukprot:TRINITY_DN4863_c0_g1_i1.p1 TRINITY_DN4863_c0_g1~~TRINITY_DN4863_c0_g1_i1.p1  ORF type:complete len:278 (-),score=55.15 TRINITY_DN4863_c0_g1_i1:100-933(-)
MKRNISLFETILKKDCNFPQNLFRIQKIVNHQILNSWFARNPQTQNFSNQKFVMLHSVLATGWTTERTVVLDDSLKAAMSPYFLPIGTCSVEDAGPENNWNVFEHYSKEKTMYLDSQSEISNEINGLSLPIKKFHRRPSLWFFGQFVKYTMRFNRETAEKLDDVEKKLFGEKRPLTMAGIEPKDSEFTLRQHYEYVSTGFHSIFVSTFDDSQLSDFKGSKTDWYSSNQLKKEISDEKLRKIAEISILSQCHLIVGSERSDSMKLAFELLQNSIRRRF